MSSLISRLSRSGLVAAVVGLVVAASVTGMATAAPSQPDATAPSAVSPPVAPTLREWTGAPGQFRLRPGSRIVVGTGVPSADAVTFRDDLRSVTGRNLPVGRGEAVPGDIDLSVHDGGLPASGYRLTVGQTVAITGQDAQGLFYATQSVEQILKASPAAQAIPSGTGTDWPALGTRGIMLDLARHFQPVSYVEAQIRSAAWYKLNEVHLHLTDSQGYLLPSGQYPQLPAAQHYTASDVAAIVRYADRYHVTLVPEVDLPAHATPITTMDPSLKWSCPSVGDHTYFGSLSPGFNLDITNPAATTLAEQLLHEVTQLFPHSPVIHIGGDEYASYQQQQACPELVSYADSHGYASTVDVFTTWQNTLAGYLRSLGRTTEVWNWWDTVGHTTVEPDRAILVEPWYTNPASFYDGPGGYRVISAPDDSPAAGPFFLYVSPGTAPGGPEVPEDVRLYDDWQPANGNPNLLGYESPLWAGPPARTSAYDQWFTGTTWPVLADRTWGGRKLPSLFDFQDVVSRIGSPPGRPDAVPAGQQVVQGTPYGSPATDGSHAAAQAFDADPATSYRSSGDGAYVGIDAGSAARVTGVRYVPVPDPNPDSYAAGGLNESRDLVDAEFQGCTAGPTTGCVNLAHVSWRSTYDWHQLAATDQGRYRWLRLVSSSGQPLHVAELQFLTAPNSTSQVDIVAPATAQAGTDATVDVTLANQTRSPERFEPSLAVTNITDLTTLATHRLSASMVTVPPHGSVTVSWRVAVPPDATLGPEDIAVRAPFQPLTGNAPDGAVSALAGLTVS